jgi:NADP-dependent 3-hydroxy acid dehydrogenase YdfG
MLKRNKGHIINLGSVAGRWVYPGGSVYCGTKHFVRAFSESLRLDLMGSALRVTTIEPGAVVTEFSEVRLRNKQKAKQVYEGYEPLRAQDIAESIFWCLQRPAHVNIQELVIFPTAQAGVGYIAKNTDLLKQPKSSPNSKSLFGKKEKK